MEKYEQYPGRIQFLKRNYFPDKFQEELTIDYTLQMLTYSCVDNVEHTSSSKRKRFGSNMDELFSLSSCDIFLDWLDKEEQPEPNGYRDGWKIVCYMTLKEDDKSLVYSMQQIYKDSPFEKLLSWLKAFAPEIVPNW